MSAKSGSALTPARIRAWLEGNPEFLVKNPQLLEQMEMPKEEGGTLSFQAYQAQKLRERNAQLEAMFQVAVHNQGLIDHALMMAAESLADRPRSLTGVVRAQERRLHRHFPNGGWAIRLRPEIRRVSDRYRVPEHAPLIRALMAVFRKGPQILVDRETVAMLWPKSSAGSDTLVVAPLKRRRRYGILCRELSPDVDRIGDTTLLLHVASLTAAMIERFYEPKKSS